MIISRNIFNQKANYSKVIFKQASKEPQLEKTKPDVHSEWDWHAKVQDDDIPERLKQLKLKIGQELQKSFSLLGFKESIVPEVVFRIPDSIPYRNFFPIAGINNRLKQATQKINGAFKSVKNEDKKNDGHHSIIYKLVNDMYSILGISMSQKLEDKLEHTEDPVKRDEILRHFMFDSSKTACVNLDISHKSLNIDIARLNALFNEIIKDPEVGAIYPDFEKTFVEMLTADVILKYQTMSFMKDSLINPQLLWKSFKSAYRFILGIPGIIDTPLALTETIKHYATGIYNFKKIIQQVNDQEFSSVKVDEAVKVFPLYTLEMLERIKPQIAKVQFDRKNVQIEKYLHLIKILEEIDNIPQCMKDRIMKLTRDNIKPIA